MVQRRAGEVITQLQTWRADVAVVKAQFVAAFERGAAGTVQKIQADLLAPRSGRTKAENPVRDFKRRTAAA